MRTLLHPLLSTTLVILCFLPNIKIDDLFSYLKDPKSAFHFEEKSFTTLKAKKNYALFFAVDQYNDENLADLNNPIKDAVLIARDLEEHFDYKTEVIDNPTLDEIDQKIREYTEFFLKDRSDQQKNDEHLVIYFSGHGMVENEIGYFLPSDADNSKLYRTAFAYDLWRKTINAINCKHILVVIDACFSGTFDPIYSNRFRSGNKRGRPGELSEGEKLVIQNEKYQSRQFFTSGAQVRTPDKSEFAKQFLEGLRTWGGEDGILTSSELFTYLEKADPKPHKGTFGDDEPSSNFLFILNEFSEYSQINPEVRKKKGKELAAWKQALDQNTALAFQKYLEIYPYGNYRGQAIEKIKFIDQNEKSKLEDVDWERVTLKNTTDAYNDYLIQYPDGKYRSEAKLRMEELKRTNILMGKMQLVEGNTFEMGDLFGDGHLDEKPVHALTLKDFYIDRYEVTNAEYVQFLNDRSKEMEEDDGKLLLRGNIIFKLWCGKQIGDCAPFQEMIRKTSNGSFKVVAGFEEYPVVLVSWYGAVEYCNWQSQQFNLEPAYTIIGESVSLINASNGFRLPTEAEWEYAARGKGNRVKFFNNTNEVTLSVEANILSKSDGFLALAPVGSFDSNRIPVYDMNGNAAEWCFDWYHGKFYQESIKNNPHGPTRGRLKIVKGGSWNDEVTSCRIANRGTLLPLESNPYTGFRMVKNRL